MTKKIKISFEERDILSKLDIKVLEDLSSIADDSKFTVLVELRDLIIEQEKNLFFQEKEIEEHKLAILHSFSRGGVSKISSFLRIIALARSELLRRKGKDES